MQMVSLELPLHGRPVLCFTAATPPTVVRGEILLLTVAVRGFLSVGLACLVHTRPK